MNPGIEFALNVLGIIMVALTLPGTLWLALLTLAGLLPRPLAYHAALPFMWARAIGVGGLAVLALHVLAGAFVCRLPLRRLAALGFVPFYIGWKLLLLPATLLAAGREQPLARAAREMVRNGVGP